MKDYLDISFMTEEKTDFKEVPKKGLKEVQAFLTLTAKEDALLNHERLIVNRLEKQLPVKYKDGIFRIVKIGGEDDGENSMYRFEITGKFSEDDPNGERHNGWEEVEETEEVKISNSISVLSL